MRPWKAEQLGGGYRVSSWVEKTAVEAADAVIAVSSGMRDDVLHTYPALDPNRVHVVKNGIEPTFGIRSQAREGTGRRLGARRTRRRSDSPDRGLRRADHPAEGGRAPGRGGPPLRARDPAGAVRRRSGHPGDRRRGDVGGAGAGPRPQRRVLGSGDAADRQDPRNTLSSNSFRVSVGVRAVGDREPGGDGLRDGGGGIRCRRHTGGGRGPSDGSAGALRPRRPRVLRAAAGRGGQLAGGRSGEGAPVRRGRAAAVYPRIFLGAHRRADLGDLPQGVCHRFGAEHATERSRWAAPFECASW